jgi:hypothetical protein
VNAKKAHRLTDYLVTKETTRMTLFPHFLRRLSPFSSAAATTQARGDDTATRVVAVASAGPSEARTQGAGIAALFRRLTTQHRAVSGVVSVAAALGVGAFSIATPASAQAAAPWWHLDTSVRPAVIPPAGEGVLDARASNLGNETTSGPSILSLELPAGLELVEEGGVPQVTFVAFHNSHGNLASKRCAVSASLITCQTEPSDPTAAYAAYITAKLAEFGIPDEPPHREQFEEAFTRQAFEEEEDFVKPLAPYEYIDLRVKVRATGAAPGPFTAVASGAAAAVSRRQPVRISGSPPAFGAESYELLPEEEGGSINARAGSHPYQLTTTFALNQNANEPTFSGDEQYARPPALARNLHFRLPPGQIGNPTTVPRCDALDFSTYATSKVNLCPPDTAIGVASVTFDEPVLIGLNTYPVPLWNLQPAFGEPARFGFEVFGTPVILDTAVRSGKAGTPDGDYGVTVTTANTSQLINFIAASVTFWGTPGDPSHDGSRGWSCLSGGQLAEGVLGPCKSQEQKSPAAFLTLPTDCGSPFATTVEGDSWTSPTSPVRQLLDPVTYSLEESGNPRSLIGCNQLPFDPQIHSEPTSNAATSPTGLGFDINFEDQGLLNPAGRAQSQMKKAVVTLPQGFTTNPSVAEGLKACSEAEYEASTLEPNSGCNSESKIGEVEITSPLVEPSQVVKGGLYVAKQGENPSRDATHPNGNLLTIYLVARNPEIGVLVKQALKVTPNPVTGQLTTEVDNVPELPFSHFHLFFRTGQRSPLVTPPACGPYTVKALMYPWSNPTAPVERTSSFQITQGPEGQPCPSGNTPPFHPVLEAGTLNNAAGSYSPFYTHISRKDSEQEITHFSIKLPPGVSGKLAGIPECSDQGIAAAKAREHEGGGGEEEASSSCPKASEVGHSLVGSGVGNVLAYAPGKLYLAGPYHGSNLSLVSITAAKVGPFDLGTVVVRFALKIDPETAEVSVDGATSDPIPHIVDGIPVHLRDIRAYVDRPQFVLNPTSCKKTSTASTVLGSGLNFASEADDVPVTVTSPFQAADCASLGFKPNLALSLKGGTKRGATPAFKAVLTYPKGSYANIAESQVTLPHSEFLEQSHIGTVCTRAQFKEGKIPGEKCPAASVYGRARAVTPILSEPLEGPVYLRSSSHNLPDLVAALHNNQVDIALDGRIDSVENGRIRNTFEAVPDAPVSKFVLEMQGGKKGLLVNSTDICRTKHKAISHFVGQNGKVWDTNPVLSAKCGKAKKKSHKKGAKAKKGKRASRAGR